VLKIKTAEDYGVKLRSASGKKKKGKQTPKLKTPVESTPAGTPFVMPDLNDNLSDGFASLERDNGTVKATPTPIPTVTPKIKKSGTKTPKKKKK